MNAQRPFVIVFACSPSSSEGFSDLPEGDVLGRLAKLLAPPAEITINPEDFPLPDAVESAPRAYRLSAGAARAEYARFASEPSEPAAKVARLLGAPPLSRSHRPDTDEIRRHRHDNRLAMSMLARLDRMADAPAEGSDAALARIVAQDFTAYCDMICPYAVMLDEVARDELPLAGHEPSARTSADAQTLLGERPGDPDPVEDEAALLVTSAASVAMFIAVRRNLLSTTAQGGPLGPVAHGETGLNPPFSAAHERCELRPPEAFPHLMDLPPEEAAAGLRGVWWDTLYNAWRTDFPPPPDFTGEETDEMYDPDDYQRELTIDEEQAVARQLEAEYRPYKEAAIRARDIYFGFDAAAAGRDNAADSAEPAGATRAADPPH